MSDEFRLWYQVTAAAEAAASCERSAGYRRVRLRLAKTVVAATISKRIAAKCAQSSGMSAVEPAASVLILTLSSAAPAFNVPPDALTSLTKLIVLLVPVAVNCTVRVTRRYARGRRDVKLRWRSAGSRRASRPPSM